MSNGPQFFETRMGMKFYEGTMPRIAEALKDIAESLKAQARKPDDAVWRESTICDECGAAIPDSAKSMVSRHHAPSCSLAPENVGRSHAGPVPMPRWLLDEIVDLVRHIAEDTRSASVEESTMATALLARIEKETK